jgi:hypothetical protein
VLFDGEPDEVGRAAEAEYLQSSCSSNNPVDAKSIADRREVGLGLVEPSLILLGRTRDQAHLPLAISLCFDRR